MAVDPDAAKHVAEAFRLFGDDRCTYYQIAELFNTLAAGGSISWRAKSIRRLLENPIYIGIQVWNKTCRVKDTETEKEVTVENPRREWVVTRIPQLRIVDNQLWKRVRRRMKAIRTASPLTGRAPSRNERSASTMVSGTLFCGYCKSEIKLARSGKYSSMCCFNGLQHVNGCELSSCKSLRVIEESLVDYVSNQVLTEDRVKELVRLTNSAITLEASRPRIDPKPLRSSAQTLQRRIDKFIELVDEEPDRDECRSLRQHIKSLEQQLRAVNTEIGKAEAQSAPPPAFLRVDEVLSLLNELRGLLNQAPAAAAEVLRDITGPIRITHERHGKGRRGAKWIAEFEPRLGPALAKVAKARLCLDSAPSELRRCSIWTILAKCDAPLDCTPKARVEIDCVPAYVRIAPQALELSKAGARQDLIAAKLGVSRKLVGDALRFAKLGITPSTNPADRTDSTRRFKATPGYAKWAERVAQLRSEADRTFRQISLELGISRATARRAFLYFLRTRNGAITT